MQDFFDNIHRRGLVGRRDFLRFISLSAAGVLAGCAANPVTGKSELMLISESQEINIDRKNSPHQFSSDYGITQDRALNDYINRTGKRLAAISHRPYMPYSFQVVNATYVNAYAFPGGSIAVTRGILLKLRNEAELAGLLGHELGHVNARHTARQMSKGMLALVLISGASIAAGTYAPGYDRLISQLGMIGAGALLASYSRENEREADSLAMVYMVQAGYSSQGFVGLMDMLSSLFKRKFSAAELLFATHPMSDERYQTAVAAVRTKYRYAKNQPLYKERYMDNTANLRAIREAIEEMQKGEKQMRKQNYDKAQDHFQVALKKAPNDYTALVLMSKTMIAKKRYDSALRYAEEAKQVYPNEAQAHHLGGFIKIKKKQYEAAYEDFSRYEKLLPGNPNTLFFMGLSLEGMKRYREAAGTYCRYLRQVREGRYAQHAYRRLVQWRYDCY
ncbi:MAG: M48 family metalloprotease [Deltaproteobacteria bacterium]|nr:M48 family metalloprotease [Deltaproteobacteria bacterium]MBW2150322.1 M48 family metalloprotease [Deltaproteobacteria bacterium]